MFLRSLNPGGRPRTSSYVVIIFFGLALSAMVTARLKEEHLIRAEGVQVTGIAQGFETLGGTNDTLIYSYEFRGRRYEVRELVSDRLRGRLAPGDPVALWVRPEQPDQPMIEDRGTTSPWVGLVIGLLLVLGGVFGLVQFRRR